MREYLVTLLISAALCYLITPFVRTQAIRFGAVAQIRGRDIHTTPTARWGWSSDVDGNGSDLHDRQSSTPCR